MIVMEFYTYGIDNVLLYRVSEDLDEFMEVLDNGAWKPASDREVESLYSGSLRPIDSAAAATIEARQRRGATSVSA